MPRKKYPKNSLNPVSPNNRMKASSDPMDILKQQEQFLKAKYGTAYPITRDPYEIYGFTPNPSANTAYSITRDINEIYGLIPASLAQGKTRYPLTRDIEEIYKLTPIEKLQNSTKYPITLSGKSDLYGVLTAQAFSPTPVQLASPLLFQKAASSSNTLAPINTSASKQGNRVINL